MGTPLTVFGSTNTFTQTLSNMNFITSKPMHRPSDVSLDTCLKLKTTTYFIDRNKLYAEKNLENSTNQLDKCTIFLFFMLLYSIELYDFNLKIIIKFSSI